MSRHPRPRPQRVAWFEGSRLTHRDLADAVEHEARMLELHVRTVHDTHGIAFGLTTALGADLRSVAVERGLAYTCRGASVILPAVASIAAPPSSLAGGVFDLVLVPARAPSQCGSPDVDCTGQRIRPSSHLEWLPVDEREHCACDDDTVHLGRFTRTPSGTLTGPDNTRRRTVRGLTRPHVASGITAPGSLDWQQGSADLYARIDTSAAGFTTAPVYLASVASPLPWSGGLVAPFVSVGQSAPTHFNVHIMIAAKPPALSLLFAQIDVAKELAIAWIGVEHAVGCAGGPSLYATLTPYLSALGAFK
jgi:hypothetical protein